MAKTMMKKRKNTLKMKNLCCLKNTLLIRLSSIFSI